MYAFHIVCFLFCVVVVVVARVE